MNNYLANLDEKIPNEIKKIFNKHIAKRYYVQYNCSRDNNSKYLYSTI